MATHSSILAWRILWTEEPGGLPTIHGVAKSQTQLEWLCRQAVFCNLKGYLWRIQDVDVSNKLGLGRSLSSWTAPIPVFRQEGASFPWRWHAVGPESFSGVPSASSSSLRCLSPLGFAFKSYFAVQAAGMSGVSEYSSASDHPFKQRWLQEIAVVQGGCHNTQRLKPACAIHGLIEVITRGKSRWNRRNLPTGAVSQRLSFRVWS